MSSVGVTVRDYVDTDAAGVIAVAQELQTHETGIFDRMRPVADIGTSYLEHLKSEVAKHEGRFLVAESVGKIVGYATLLTQCDSRDEADEVLYSYAYVGDLAVTEVMRRRGVGQSLVAACEAIARAAGQKWLRLSVLAGNSEARQFYARQGFADNLVLLEKTL